MMNKVGVREVFTPRGAPEPFRRGDRSFQFRGETEARCSGFEAPLINFAKGLML